MGQQPLVPYTREYTLIGPFRNKPCAGIESLQTWWAPWVSAFPPGWMLKASTVSYQREDGGRWQLQVTTVSEYLQCEESTKPFEYPLRTEDRECLKGFSTIPPFFLWKAYFANSSTWWEIMSLDQVWFLERESWVKTYLHIYAVLMAGFHTYSCISNNNSSFENKALLNVLILNRKFKQLPF